MNTNQRNMTAIDPVKLDRLAEVAIKIGLRLAPGQDLLLTAPTAALPLVRRIAEHAYRAGAGLVTPLFSDEEITLSRYRFAPDDGFDRAPGWLYDGMSKAFAANTARLAIVGDNPMLLAGEDPVKVARASKANSVAYQPALEKIVNFDINWNIIAYPSPSWAKQVFPGDEEDVAVAKLADAIFAASRVDNDDPIAAWEKHNATLRNRTEWLNAVALPVGSASARCITPDRVWISRSGSPRAMNGQAAPPPPKTASPAIPIFRPRKCSPLRMRGG